MPTSALPRNRHRLDEPGRHGAGATRRPPPATNAACSRGMRTGDEVRQIMTATTSASTCPV